MKIILFMAMSADGFIARKNGEEDFLSDINWQTFGALAKKHGCFITGRKTYEIVQKWPDYNFDDIDARLKIVVSHGDTLKLSPPFLLAHSSAEAIEKATAMNFKSAILVGGSTINSAFLKENLIDEVILNIEPAFVGSGIPLFSEGEFNRRLDFVGAKRIAEGVVQLTYKINKN
jgi:dihydrofolate reductase